jgi:NitT/TauT family transport system substrate-binding protein
MDKVTYLSGVGILGREGYAWVAQEKGFFRDAGIEVTLQGGAAGDANLKLLASDQAQFAAIDFTGGILQVGAGTYKDIRFVATIQQRTLICLVTLDGSGITTPRDLEGKTVTETTGSVIGKLFPTYARLAGVDKDKVKFASAPTAQLPTLLTTGKTDAIGYFVVGTPTVEAVAGGRKLVTLPYDQYLTDLYGTALVTTTKLTQSNPDLVKRFRGALMKGLEYSIDHPDETGEIVHKVQATVDAKIAAAEVKLMAPYVRGGASVGAFDQARVARSIAILQGAGAVPSGLTPDMLVDWSLAK